ncbi:hypothetical protein K4F52_007043 [Lecanicillium sp. MT-2017a]|nr:hypothetical protein K4F52_007043 [Lecanicillium sp. MT-2017a]
MDRQNRVSLTPSDTTYYSFHDIELTEPPGSSAGRPADRSKDTSTTYYTEYMDDRFEASGMQRQDSGYESYGGSPRTSISQGRPKAVRQNSSTSTAQVRSRPSTRRSTKSYNTYRGSQPYQVRSYAQSQPVGYVQFPALDLVELAEPSNDDVALAPQPPQPPQTTHYWTSDSTRRLEYAAIDAASRGVKGWVRRHLVPDCLVPRDSKHVAFDDDSGSVRRYRLHLEDDNEKHRCSNMQRRKSSWRFWRE